QFLRQRRSANDHPARPARFTRGRRPGRAGESVPRATTDLPAAEPSPTTGRPSAVEPQPIAADRRAGTRRKHGAPGQIRAFRHRRPHSRRPRRGLPRSSGGLSFFLGGRECSVQPVFPRPGADACGPVVELTPPPRQHARVALYGSRYRHRHRRFRPHVRRRGVRPSGVELNKILQLFAPSGACYPRRRVGNDLPVWVEQPRLLRRKRRWLRAAYFGTAHSRTVLSALPESTWRPSAVKATVFTLAACPS